MTLREAITDAANRLSGHEDLRDDALRDSQFLLLNVLGERRTALFTDAERVLSESEVARYEAFLARRLSGEPIQYIVGEQEFYGLPLKVTPAVLIPRPETELLVEAALGQLPKEKAIRVIDVGTGSGAIAIAVAHHLPFAEVFAVDLSEAALEVARENAARHGLSERIHFLQSDLLNAVEREARYDAVLSNPPYIPQSDKAGLHRQVREFEPATALFAGVDGLEIYRRLIPQAAAVLKPGGLLAFEIGFGQHDDLRQMLRGWSEVQVLNDLQGVPRVVIARWEQS